MLLLITSRACTVHLCYRLHLDGLAAAQVVADFHTSLVPCPCLCLCVSQEMLEQSGKMALLAQLLTKLHAGGHKVLIFSQVGGVIDLM